MLTERAEGLMCLSRVAKYALVALSALATAVLCVPDGSTTATLSSMALPAAIMFLALTAWGPGASVWGRSYFRQPVQTTLMVTLVDTVIAALSLLAVRLWPAVAVGMPLGLCLVTSGTALLLLNRFLPKVLSKLLYGRKPRSRVLVLGPPNALELIRRQILVGRAVGLEFVDGTAATDESRELRLFNPEDSSTAAAPALAPLHSRIHDPDSPHAVDRVIFVRHVTTLQTLEQEQEIQRQCETAGLPLTVYVEHSSLPFGSSVARTAMAADPFAASQEPLQNIVNLAAKRTADILVSIPFVLFILPPLCALVWIAHRAQSPGPLFYRQKRCGLNGATFSIFKFRTMHLPDPGQTDLEDNPAPRIFELGAVLRDSRLDEIPQFINVLLGTMSIVGPRAHHGKDRDRFSQLVPHYLLRMQVKPGITGPAQYREYQGVFARNNVGSRVECDLEYISRWSLLSDLLLMLKTGRVIAESLSANVTGRLRRPSSMPAPHITSISLDKPALASLGNTKRTDHQRDQRAA